MMAEWPNITSLIAFTLTAALTSIRPTFQMTICWPRLGWIYSSTQVRESGQTVSDCQPATPIDWIIVPGTWVRNH